MPSFGNRVARKPYGGREAIQFSFELSIGQLADIIGPKRTRMLQLGRRFPPAGAGLEPEDLGGHVPVLGGIEKKTRDLGIRLGRTEIDFVPVVFAKSLRIDADHPRDVGFRNSVGGQRLDLATLSWIG